MIQWFIKLLALSTILNLLCNAGSVAGTKYVSPTGSAAWGDCTAQGSPCSKSTAISNAAAGDIVYFLDGTYSDGFNSATSGTCSRWSDSDTNKVVFQALNRGQAVIAGTGSTSVTVLLDTNCIAFRGFSVVIPDEANSTTGIRSTGSNNEISYNSVSYNGSLVPTSGFAHADAIVLRASAWAHQNTIESATIGVTIQGAGAGTLGYPGLVENNNISNLSAGDIEDADCFAVQKNNSDGDFSGFVIRYNECSGWSDDGFDGYDSSGVTVVQNVFDTPHIDATHPTCLKPGYFSSGSMIFGNRCFGMPTSGATTIRCIDSQGAGNATISGNLCVGGSDGIYISQGAGTGDNNSYNNNTILGSSRYGVFLAESSATGAVLRNNFLQGATSDMLLTASGSLTGSYNRFLNDKDSKGSGTYLDGVGDTEGAVTFDAEYHPTSDIGGIYVFPYWSIDGKCLGDPIIGATCQTNAVTVPAGYILRHKRRN